MEEMKYNFRSHIFSFLCEHFSTVPEWEESEPEKPASISDLLIQMITYECTKPEPIVTHGTIFSNCGKHQFSASVILTADTGKPNGVHAVTYVTPMQDIITFLINDEELIIDIDIRPSTTEWNHCMNESNRYHSRNAYHPHILERFNSIISEIENEMMFNCDTFSNKYRIDL